MDYKQKIFNAESQMQRDQLEMIRFSTAIMEAMHLSQDDVDLAIQNDIDWRIGNYNITPRGFPWNSWQTLLIATPATSAGGKAGYFNSGDNNNMPASWTFVTRGTASIILPDFETQKQILNLV